MAVRGNEGADVLVEKVVVVDGKVTVRERVDLFRAGAVKLQNEEETECDNVHIQKMIDECYQERREK